MRFNNFWYRLGSGWKKKKYDGKRLVIAVLAMTILLCAFDNRVNEPELSAFYITGLAQGTSYAITYYGEKESISKDRVDSIFSSIDQSLSIYKPGSVISRFNASESGMETDAHFQNVVTRALEVYRATGGAFDITVLPLVQAWGFGTEKVDHLPDSSLIASMLPCVGSDKIRLGNNRLDKLLACTKIDVNGIAQGYSVDVVADFLEANHIDNYLVEVGGEIRIKGKKYPGGKPMRIGIEAPSKNEFDHAGIRKVIELEQGAVTTSGNYRKFRQSGSRKISHIINPKTGFSAQTTLISVTVVADDAMTADGYDNAFMVMGVNESLQFLERHKNIQAYFIFQKPDGSVGDTATVGFNKYFR
jgi:thiamine biosynthesis lipoprotein